MTLKVNGFPWRLVGWGSAAALLLTPLVAMQFTDEVDWTAFDFAVMGGLLTTVGLGVEFAVRRSGDLAYRLGAGAALLAAFLLVWVNGAVGFLGDEDNPANLAFAGVIVVAAIGAALSGFRAAGMAKAMIAAAFVQAAIGVAALAAGWASPGYQGLYEVVMGTSLFAALWLVSAGLFRRAAGADQRPAQAR